VAILKDYVLQLDWVDVRAQLKSLFPQTADLVVLFHMPYKELTQLEPSASSLRLVIGNYDPQGAIPFYVVGFENDCLKGFSPKFIPWQKWLGACIDPLTLNQYPIAKIVAICFYDMLWAGFSSDEVETFRREYINHEQCLWSVHAYAEDIEASESNLIKRKQRLGEFHEALNLYDLDFGLLNDTESDEYRQARLETQVNIYCLGESETDYDQYCAKVDALRNDFLFKWPDPSSKFPFVQ
jgi:hypothetical protein